MQCYIRWRSLLNGVDYNMPTEERKPATFSREECQRLCDDLNKEHVGVLIHWPEWALWEAKASEPLLPIHPLAMSIEPAQRNKELQHNMRCASKAAANSQPEAQIRHGGFTVICPRCSSSNCTVSGYLRDCQIAMQGVSANVMIVCEDCEAEWNEQLTEATDPASSN